MAKSPLMSVKYKIIARFEVNAPVDIPDVIGAIFGQTEGLFGDDFDLKELQRQGKIGRVSVKIEEKTKDKTRGIIEVPSAMSKEETAILAAAIEVVDRIGPGNAKIIVEKIEDIRETKRKYVLTRAKELLKNLMKEIPKGSDVIEDLKKDIREELEVIEYEGLPAGKGIFNSKEIIIVEGRADVNNLVRHGITNVIATNGLKVPEVLKDLTKDKVVTVFVDGDRGGELLMRELINNLKVDFVARAPSGKEVEELSEKELIKALRKKEPAFLFKTKYNPIEKKLLMFKDEVKDKGGAILFDKDLNIIAKVPIEELDKILDEYDNIYALVIDNLDDELAKKIKEKQIEYVIVV